MERSYKITEILNKVNYKIRTKWTEDMIVPYNRLKPRKMNLSDNNIGVIDSQPAISLTHTSIIITISDTQAHVPPSITIPAEDTQICEEEEEGAPSETIFIEEPVVDRHGNHP